MGGCLPTATRAVVGNNLTCFPVAELGTLSAADGWSHQPAKILVPCVCKNRLTPPPRVVPSACKWGGPMPLQKTPPPWPHEAANRCAAKDVSPRRDVLAQRELPLARARLTSPRRERPPLARTDSPGWTDSRFCSANCPSPLRIHSRPRIGSPHRK